MDPLTGIKSCVKEQTIIQRLHLDVGYSLRECISWTFQVPVNYTIHYTHVVRLCVLM